MNLYNQRPLNEVTCFNILDYINAVFVILVYVVIVLSASVYDQLTPL